MSLAEPRTLSAFKSNVEDLALEELSRLEDDRQELEATLDAVKTDIKALKAVLSAVNPTQVKPKQRKSQSAAAFVMSQEREGECLRWLTGNTDEITKKTMRGQFPGWSDSYCSMSLKMLRDTGVIRLSATSGSQNIYRSLI